MNISIVIPAYNEEKFIGQVISNLQSAGYKNIIVVDDGSADNTKNIAKEKGAVVVEHIMNRGQGASLKTGIDYALKTGAEYIVTFDADGQHRVEDLKLMLDPVISGKADISLGSRFLQQENKIPVKRKILLKGSLLVQYFFYKIKLTDVHNGFRVFSKKAAQQINITCDKMDHASEIVEEIKKKNLSYTEVPIIINYSEETLAKGHGSFRQALKILYNMIFKRLLR